MGLIPGSGRSPGGRNGNPLQYSCLENSMDQGAWWATVHVVEKSQTCPVMEKSIPWACGSTDAAHSFGTARLNNTPRLISHAEAGLLIALRCIALGSLTIKHICCNPLQQQEPPDP